MSSLDEESIEDRSDAASEAASEAVVVDGGVASQDKDDDDDDDDTAQADIESMAPDDEDDATTIKSEADETSIASKRKRATPKGKKGRSPAVKGLTIPFRNVKRTMKLDPDIATVQQEAAILTTLASELFLKSLAKESYQNAQSRGRTTIRYEDIAEARTKDPSLAFLDTLLP